MTDTYLTRETLLKRLKLQSDEMAWEEFVFYYRDFIYSILVKMNINRADWDDLLQKTLLKIWKSIPDFDYDQKKGQFRGWVHTIAKNTILSYISHNKHISDKNESIEKNLNEQFSEPEVDSIINEEWESHLSELAFDYVSRKVSENAMEAFLAGLRGEKICDTAQQLNISEDMVYTYRNRVKNRIVAEITNLRERLE